MALSAELFQPVTPLSVEEELNRTILSGMIVDLSSELHAGLPYEVKFCTSEYAEHDGVVIDKQGTQIIDGTGTKLWTRRWVSQIDSPVELVAQGARVKDGEIVARIGAMIVHCTVDVKTNELIPKSPTFDEFSTEQKIEFVQDALQAARMLRAATVAREQQPVAA